MVSCDFWVVSPWHWASLHAFLEKCLFKSFAHFKIWLFVFLWLSSKSSLYILDTSLLTDIWFANIFSHSLGSLLTFLIVCLMHKSSLPVFVSEVWLEHSHAHLTITVGPLYLQMQNLQMRRADYGISAFSAGPGTHLPTDNEGQLTGHIVYGCFCATVAELSSCKRLYGLQSLEYLLSGPSIKICRPLSFTIYKEQKTSPRTAMMCWVHV